MINLEELKKYKHIHMLGIGGTSMSGIATILKKWGFYVTGSDANESELVDKLKNNGISVVIGHDLDNLRKADLVIYIPNFYELMQKLQEKFSKKQ